MAAQPRLACRSCGAELEHTFVDLGATPLATSYLRAADLAKPERRYPLHARVCESCFLVQVDSVVPAEEIFGDYAYFSSYAATWVEHARKFADAAIERFGLDQDSLVVEVASNDGYLLRHFVDAGVPVLGVEPAANVAEAAIAAGVPTEVRFFGEAFARELLGRQRSADLLVGNNVLAHVPNLNDFVAGLAQLLKPTGVLSMEFPHLLRLIEEVQFDTIYHEHFSYFSFLAVERVFARHGLEVFDVERLSTHGGSLRIFTCRRDGVDRPRTAAVEALRSEEKDARLDCLEGYAGFAERVEAVKTGLLGFLNKAKAEGHTVVGYGAAAKGNTLLNTCGVDGSLIDYVVDLSPHKQGHFLPGSRLPIHAPERMFETRPDYVLILPWNLKDEIVKSMAGIGEWGGRFVVAIPCIQVVS
jgi:SAM-dependent methyltransferase